MGKPFETWAEMEETYHFVKDNCPQAFERTCRGQEGGIPYEEATSIRHQAAMQTAKENQNPQPTKAEVKKGNQHASKTQVPKTENGTCVSHGSNQASTRIRRLRRDHPEAAERLERGEFKSVAAQLRRSH